MKLALEIITIWLALNITVGARLLYVGRKRQKFLDWHEAECAESRKRFGISA